MKDNARIRALFKQSWSMSWQMSMIMLFVFFIGIADVYVAGRLGKDIQAAYGIAFQLYFIFSIIASALTVGTVSLVSRLFTSGRREEFDTAVESSFIASVAAGRVFALLGVVFSPAIIAWLHIPHALKAFVVPLTRVYSFGLLFNYILFNTNGILRACGQIGKSLLTMAIVCSLNVVLNLALALKTPLGFLGIGVATVISIFAGSMINSLRVKKIMSGALTFSMAAIKKIVAISWPAGLLQVLWQLGTMSLFLILSRLPKYNIEILAAFTNGLKIESAIFLPAFAFNMAAAVVVGNILGKSERQDAFSAGVVTAMIGVAIVSAMTVLVMFNARAIAAFLSPDPIVIEECVKYIYISLLAEPFMAWGVILAGALNGAGDTKSVMAIVAACVWAVRIPLSFLLAIYFGLGAVSVWWAMNISILIQTVFISRRYFSRRWIAHSEKTFELRAEA